MPDIDTALLEDFDNNMDNIRSYLHCKYDIKTAEHVYQALLKKISS